MKSILTVLLVISSCLALYTWRSALTGLASSEDTVPTTQVRKGDLTVFIKATGDIKAMRSVTLYAPFSVTDVRLVQVTKGGTMVKKGDVVAVLDATMEQNKVKEQESNVTQANKETDKIKAQHRQVDEQASLDQAQARFDVESAKLDTKKGEIVSEIDAGKAKLTLATNERHLEELVNDDSARGESKTAELNVVGRKRAKAENDRNFAQSNIEKLTIRAPIDGMLIIMQNWRAQQGCCGNAPEFKAGDAGWPGCTIAEIPDMKTLLLELSVEETDRGRVAVGQMTRVKVDAIPDKTFTGKIKEITTTAQLVFEGWPPKKLFKARVDLAPEDDRLRPNMSAHADLEAEKLSGVILVPSRATFDRNGHTIVWVRRDKRFEPREIVIGKKSEGMTQVVTGLKEGDVVALEEPKSAAVKGGA